ncbi:interferon-induced GTP-binding protein Mx2 isoform X2 [Nycticebus coucang]|uniref:interferon-induced GTP-binding protein Mx2 isoform X2 n=1 Tax=Nycticebus coucang TaxID=9470 RepID=UPI00234D47D7|nr:interferon-induced GTP-binding protein Mx2 isoform X2 [Nycticebus coucang]
MSKVHRERNPSCLPKEIDFFQQQTPPLGATPKLAASSPDWQGAGEDTTFLTMDFHSLNLNNQLPQDAKNNLYNQHEEKVRPCIDLIDSLRALGVEQDLALPAIAVIGDQSSGKRSVLEALSGVSLPRGTGIVTRCPLVLKLKKQQGLGEWAGRISYRNMEQQLQHPAEVEPEIRKAHVILAGNGVGISHELISLEITSPEVPDLTIIDLPGIARVAIGNQPPDIGLQIKALIKKYIQREQTINLVVVPCNVDIATTEALSMAQEVDPDGTRTIGILTKPDLVDRGTEKGVLNLAQNLVYPLKKGYMIVKCRGQQDVINKMSLAEATKKEMEFFEKHSHYRILLEEGKATVPCLAERLTMELVVHIKESFPVLENQIREQYQRATEELRGYGADVPSEEAEKMFFLIEKIRMFNQDIEKLIQGEEAIKENESCLYNKLRKEWKHWMEVLAANTRKIKNIIHEDITRYENQYRGKELPEFLNYKMFEIIVHQYIQQLVDPALDMLQRVAEIVHQVFIDMAQKHFSEFSTLCQEAQSKIEIIKAKEVENAEKMIHLQFEMEQLVYCQDQIYSVLLKKVREEIFNPMAKGTQNIQWTPPVPKDQVSCITEIAVHLNTYFRETSKRLANQIPIIIQYFILRVNGDWLQKAMMHMLHKTDNYSLLIQEQSETTSKRRFLKERIQRLTQARKVLSIFSMKLFH